MQTSAAQLAKMEQEEGFSSVIYIDGGGVRTVGFGTTEADVSPLPNHITVVEGRSMFQGAVRRKYEPDVDRLHLENQNQYDACVDIAYNCGTGILFAPHTLGIALAKRDWTAAANAMLLYVHDANGNIEPGLVTRRQYDHDKFLEPWMPPVPPDPHHYGWLDKTERHLGTLGIHSEAGAVGKYDAWRAMQTSRRHPHRAELGHIKDVLSAFASRLDHVIEHTHDDTTGHRGWRRRQLEARANGRRMV